jgi:hypothetical protein
MTLRKQIPTSDEAEGYLSTCHKQNFFFRNRINNVESMLLTVTTLSKEICEAVIKLSQYL